MQRIFGIRLSVKSSLFLHQSSSANNTNQTATCLAIRNIKRSLKTCLIKANFKGKPTAHPIKIDKCSRILDIIHLLPIMNRLSAADYSGVCLVYLFECGLHSSDRNSSGAMDYPWTTFISHTKRSTSNCALCNYIIFKSVVARYARVFSLSLCILIYYHYVLFNYGDSLLFIVHWYSCVLFL